VRKLTNTKRKCDTTWNWMLCYFRRCESVGVHPQRYQLVPPFPRKDVKYIHLKVENGDGFFVLIVTLQRHKLVIKT
jgi:hypothetical protein